MKHSLPGPAERGDDELVKFIESSSKHSALAGKLNAEQLQAIAAAIP